MEVRLFYQENILDGSLFYSIIYCKQWWEKFRQSDLPTMIRSSALSNDQKFWTLEAILSDDRSKIDIRCDIIASSLLSGRQKSRFIDSTSSKTTDNVVSPSKPCMSIRCPCLCSCHVMSCHVHVHIHVHASSLRN
jgi:hypothetical protein